jgi:stage II sporulation protein M
MVWLLRLRRAFALVTLLYTIGFIVGILYPWKRLISLLTSGITNPWEHGPLMAAIIIYLHNVVASLVLYALSIIYIGLAGVAFNGYVLALVSEYALQEKGFTILQLIATLLPHGVIEIPAMLLASAAGLLTFHEARRRGLKGLYKGLVVLLIAILLLAPAAFIEAFITPQIARSVGAPIRTIPAT